MTLPSTVVALRTPEAVRERCTELLLLAEHGESAFFEIDGDALARTAEYVAQCIRRNYPTLEVPYHSRWRHFQAGGSDRWQAVEREHSFRDVHERARAQFDLTIISVLLDAGAGADWAYQEAGTEIRWSRSEGLGIASFDMFASGALSCDRAAQPLRVDAHRLREMDERALASAFQVTSSNPLVGIAGRVALMQSLGAALEARPEVFGQSARPGYLYDHLLAQTVRNELPARAVLIAVLNNLSDIWPGRLQIDGVNMGDVWHHPAIKRGDESNTLVPFHKLSQWLSYSLLEPLEQAGIIITGLDALTGLAEYRNGGLLVDGGVLRLKDDEQLLTPHPVDSTLVVEWRALTVACLDRLAPMVCECLGLSRDGLSLASVLEGGTWSAGRRIARERRAHGGPPITVVSDGTVF